MKHLRLSRLCVALALAAIAPSFPVFADVTCTETVTGLIVHADGIVYFTTNQTCSAEWCSLTYSNATTATNAYALLMTATAQSKPLSFDWPALTSCASQNVAYATPYIIFLNP